MRLQFLEGRSKRVVFELGLVDHRKKARLSDDGATSGVVGDVRGQDGDRRRGKRSLPRLPSNEACQPDDERQGRKPDGWFRSSSANGRRGEHGPVHHFYCCPGSRDPLHCTLTTDWTVKILLPISTRPTFDVVITNGQWHRNVLRIGKSRRGFNVLWTFSDCSRESSIWQGKNSRESYESLPTKNLHLRENFLMNLPEKIIY